MPMFEDDIRDWLGQSAGATVQAFVEAARDGDRFPRHARFADADLLELMEQEWRGLYCFLVRDRAGLDAALDRRRRQEQDPRLEAPPEERLLLLERRLALLRNRIREDPETSRFRQMLLDRLEMATSYYRVGFNRELLARRLGVRPA